METIICLRDLDGDHVVMTQQLCQLDQPVYPECHEQDLGTVDYWLKREEQSFCFVTLIDNTPVAYLDFLVMSRAGEEAFRIGEFHDGELDGGELTVPEPPPTELTLYACSALVDKRHRGGGRMGRLLDVARAWFQKRGYAVRRIYASTWSMGGEAIVRRLGGKLCWIDSHQHSRFVIIPINKSIPYLS